LVAVVAGWGSGLLSVNAMPLTTSALLEGSGLREQAVGWLGTLEISAIAVASMAAVPWVSRISRRFLAVVGVLLVAVGSTLAGMSESFAAMAAARLVAGTGGGLAAAAANATIAATPNPERMFALVFLLGGVLAAAIAAGLPYAIEPWGYRGCFFALAALAVVGLPWLAWLPQRMPSMAAESTTRPPLNWMVVITLAAVLLFSLGDQALWAFVAEIGVRAGLALDDVGLVLSGIVIAGLAGAAVSAWLGTRWGRTLPLAVGLAGCGATRWAVVYSGAPAEYVWTSILWGTFYFLLTPYMMGTAAALDRQGRWSVAAGAMSNVGYALGPAAAGMAMTAWGDPGFAGLVAFCAFAPLALIVPASVPLDRGASVQLEAPATS
jgi:predicted MFS family arabinose efflux permease